MMNKIILLIFSGLLAACSNATPVQAKQSAPVDIIYSVPKNISSGSTLSTTIQFSAKTDLQKLTVSARPYSGIELMSGGDAIDFDKLQNNDTRSIKVNVQLTDDIGYLSVFATTINTRGRTQSKSITIRYGTSNQSTLQKMQSPHLIETPKGEQLILMPGAAR